MKKNAKIKGRIKLQKYRFQDLSLYQSERATVKTVEDFDCPTNPYGAERTKFRLDFPRMQEKKVALTRKGD